MKKFSFIYEIPLAFLFLEALNRILFPDNPGFIDVHPHPYWMIVLLFSFRYGITGGFLSGAASAASYFWQNSLHNEAYLFEDPAFYGEPVLFIVTGAVMGIGIARYRQIVDELRLQREGLLERVTVLDKEIVDREVVIRELERKVVSRMTTLVTLYEGGRQFSSVVPEELFATAMEFISKTLDLTEAAIYFREGTSFRVKINRGWSESHDWPETFEIGEGLVGRAALTGKVATLRDYMRLETDVEDRVMRTAGLMAGPIRKGENGEVIAVYCVQRMSFLNFTSATINIFSLLLNWVSRSLGRAEDFVKLKSWEIVDPRLGCYSERYFHLRLKEEFSRSMHYKLPFAVGVVKARDIESLDGSSRENLRAAVMGVLRETLREMDVVASLGDTSMPFGFILMTMGREKADEMRGLLERRLNETLQADQVRFQVGISSFDLKTSSPEELFSSAGKAADAAA